MSWNSDELERIVGLLTALAAAKGRELDEAALLGYELGLDGLSVQDIERAVRRSLRESKFMPSPAELRELAGVLSPEQRAELAFAALDEACKRYGPYRSVKFDDPLINAIVRALGGWVRACELDFEEFHKWYRRDFVRAYKSFCTSGVSGPSTEHLPGIAEQQNGVLGLREEVIRVETRLPWCCDKQRSLARPKSVKQIAE